TGKTHTIRNLICHLVAHGKRVLVLAQKEDPLRVLRAGLPEEIQPLCLAILGRSADQLVQLQIAARELSDRAATLDQAAEARWVPPEDRAAALGPLPVDGQLPTGEQLAARRDALDNAAKTAEALLDRGVALDAVRALSEAQLDELARALRTEADELTRREGSWTDRLGHLVRDPSWQAVWDAHVTATQQALADLAQRTAFLAGRHVAIPDEHVA